MPNIYQLIVLMKNGIKGKVIFRNSKNLKVFFAVAAAEDVRACRGMKRVIRPPPLVIKT